MSKETIKQAMISVLVGACVSFLTVLMQGALNILQNFPAEAPGAVVGAVRYIIVWRLHHFV